ncbi:hypothetical protein [uncultured Roseobacter sp.]|uniref:hypothetical protein n=1 Tax=uncultured Roseobacter sp. TaxID=114847 RepID=UPI0026298B29|nr:hypothetical protein [uncultured Roseobacter sp.]
MALFRCKSFPVGHMPPPNADTAIEGPRDWSITDEGSAAGDILRVDIDGPAQDIPGYKITNYEVALSQRNGATTIRRVLGGPALNFRRRFRTDTAGAPQRVQLRTCWQRQNQISWNSRSSPFYRPVPGDTVIQSATGATATVQAISNGAAAGNFFVVLQDVVGTFRDETDVAIAGNPGIQGSAMHCTHLDEAREMLVSEWSLPRDITPLIGMPSVQIIAAKTTCLQGEAITFEAVPEGFESERPTHDLHFRFFVSKSGEQGVYAALPTAFESCFGPGSNNRAEGYAQVWAFAPRTTGIVTVSCEVRDRAGNSATGTVDLEVLSPVAGFATSDIYAASAALRSVPGAPDARVFATLAELEAALPDGGEGLILLDTAEVHSPDAFSNLFLQDRLSQRCAIMPYNANGVGPSAGARARMDRALISRATECCIFGIDLVGPYDPTDPFSISDYPQNGLNTDLVGYMAVAECNLTGWRESAKLPFTGNEAAFVDLYITDYQNFGFFGGDVGKHALAGCFTFTNPRSWRAPGKSSASDNATVGFFVDHGPYRSSRPDGARGFSKCVFFSCCTWGGTGAPQSPVRLYGNASTPKPEITYGAEVLTEGGAMSINSTTRGGGDTTGHPQDFVWDKFYHLTSMQPNRAFTLGLGGTTVRNGVVATSSQPYEVNGSGIRSHFHLTNESPVPGQNDNENNPISISFVTVADLRVDSGQNTQQLILSANNPDFPMKNVMIENALTFAPNFTQSDTGAEPVDRTARWTPLYAGRYWWNANTPTVVEQTPDLSWATPPEATASYEPGPGSEAYGTAAGAVPYDDIRSRVRPSQGASRGAYDPNAT